MPQGFPTLNQRRSSSAPVWVRRKLILRHPRFLVKHRSGAFGSDLPITAPPTVILLDTNCLIRLLVSGSAEARQVDVWLEERQALCTSSICWYEFSSGPVDTEGTEIVHALHDAGILPFDARSAGGEHLRPQFPGSQIESKTTIDLVPRSIGAVYECITWS